MVKTREVYTALVKTLEQAGVEDACFEADTLIAHLAGGHRLQVDTLDEARCEALHALAARRCRHEPLQYLLGEWDFLQLRLAVGPGVLIPRPETEEVCLAAAAFLQGRPAPTVLDLCAGSGALALGLQSLCPAAVVTAVELYDEACGYLRENLARFAARHPAASPTAVQADVLDYHRCLSPQSLDLIVSNPPYVSEAEYATLAPELAFEPKTALVAEEDGLLFYKVISQGYFSALKRGGALVFEIGAGQADAVTTLLKNAGYTAVQVLPDLQGRPRIVQGRRKTQE